MKFIFLRHGKTEYNEQGLTQGWCDSPLSKTGLKQASYTKEALKDVVIDYAYCSPSGRARQTASIVLGNRDISVMIDDRLKEINFGIFEEKDENMRKEKNIESQNWYQDLDMDYRSFQGGDIREVIKQELELLGNIYLSKPDKSSVLIAGHGCSLTGLVRTICKDELDENYPDFKCFANVGVVIVDYDGTFHIEKIIEPVVEE